MTFLEALPVTGDRLLLLPGVGSLTAETIGTFDLPPVVGLAIYLATVVVLVGALVDIVVAWLDPRIRRPRALA